MLTRNTIALQKGFVCPPNDRQDNRIAVATVQTHLMQWGYLLSEDAFFSLSKADISFIKEFNNEVIDYLRLRIGGNRNYQPLYKNFPEEVLSLSDFQLYNNAIRHYWSNGTWEPTTATYEKPIKFENIKYTVIEFATPERFSQIFTDLVSINTSLTPSDMQVVMWFVNSGEKLYFPSTIPFKENLCTLAAMGIEGLPVNTTTDVLRIAVHLSGGDIGLPKVPKAHTFVPIYRGRQRSVVKTDNPARERFKFKKFTRKERKYLLALLEKSNCDIREMALKDQRWVRLGEILHPSEYKKAFPKAAAAFDKLRNEKIKTWYGTLEDAFKVSFEQGLKVLAQRPGEFARRMDWLIRENPDKVSLIMSMFADSAAQTSNKVLFEVYSHFEGRRQPVSNRSIMLKGTRTRTELPELPAIPESSVEMVHTKVFETLRDKFSKLEPLGNCWIDEGLKKIPLPTNMRSMEFSTKPTVRGQRLPIGNPDAKVIRPFVHWMDEHGNEDLDLSVTFLTDVTHPMHNVAVLSYSNLRVGNSIHSGDVRHRQGACAEYVDIDISDARERGYRYALIDVRNFNGSSLSSVECMFGIMEREHPESNATWLPETVANCQALTSEAVATLAVIIDLKTMEYITVDMDSNTITARADVNSTLKTIQELTQAPKVSVYDLVLLHVEGRGKQVTLDNNVDTYFKFEDFMHSYELTGKLMGV
jgi:hypothetical protein